MDDLKKLIIIGGGPAGVLAALTAAKQGIAVTLLEKNSDIGKKWRITGKGRCNITNVAPLEEFMRHIPGNSRFLFSAFHNFFNQDIINLLEKLGVPTKVERGGRVFPVSDKASDVTTAFKRALLDAHVDIIFNCDIQKLIVDGTSIVAAVTADGKMFKGDAFILATGGATYPLTGSDGAGVQMAKKLGHTITPLLPSLIPLQSDAYWIQDLHGLSLKNVALTVFTDDKKSAQMFGEMMFTHYGVTGPIVLSLSRDIAQALAHKKKIYLSLNLKPALDAGKLDARLQRDLKKYANKRINNALCDLLPHRLIPVITDLAFIDEETPAHSITKIERHKLVEVLQNLTFDITSTRPLAEGIITVGGINIKEVNASTMQSKFYANLFFAGEILDVDGYTGGFNLQIAFSTGYTAGLKSRQFLSKE